MPNSVATLGFICQHVKSESINPLKLQDPALKERVGFDFKSGSFGTFPLLVRVGCGKSLRLLERTTERTAVLSGPPAGRFCIPLAAMSGPPRPQRGQMGRVPGDFRGDVSWSDASRRRRLKRQIAARPLTVY